MNLFRTIAAATLLSLSTISMTGCAADATEETQRTGGFEIVAKTSSALTADDVAQVHINVYGPIEGGAVPRSFDLDRQYGYWSGRIDNLPAGTYIVDAQAVGAAGDLRFMGHAEGVTVQPPYAAYVGLNLHQMVSDPPFQNAAPFIDLLSATKATVQPGETITLRASASDADGDPLQYAWSAWSGTLAPADSAQVQWTAPPYEGPVEFTVSVNDGHGAISVAHLTVNVANSTVGGGMVVVPNFIQAPRVTSMTVNEGQPQQGEIVRVDATIETNALCGSYGELDCMGVAMQATWSSTCGDASNLYTMTSLGGITNTDVTITNAGAPCEVRLDLIDPATGVTNSGRLTLYPTAPSVQYDQP